MIFRFLRNRFVLLGSVGTVLMACAALTAQYGSAQAALRMEGNDLASAEAIQVSGNLAEIVKPLEQAGVLFHVFREIPGEYRTRAVYVSPGHTFSPPVHRKDHAPADTVREAWLGADVVMGNTEFVGSQPQDFWFNGVAYPVIGHLGLNTHSLLSADVLLSDPSLFTGYSGPMVIDGSDIAKNVAKHLSIEHHAVSPGIGNRTNGDLLSPIILALSVCVLFPGAVGLGLVAAGLVRQRNHIMRTLGWSQVYGLLRSWGETVGPLCLAGLGWAGVLSATLPLGVPGAYFPLAFGLVFTLSTSLLVKAERDWRVNSL